MSDAQPFAERTPPGGWYPAPVVMQKEPSNGGKISVSDMAKIAMVVFGALGIAGAVATAVFATKSEVAVIATNFDAHARDQRANDREVRDSAKENAKEIRLVSDTVLLIGERMKIDNLKRKE
jgi:hypothetical protein